MASVLSTQAWTPKSKMDFKEPLRICDSFSTVNNKAHTWFYLWHLVTSSCRPSAPLARVTCVQRRENSFHYRIEKNESISRVFLSLKHPSKNRPWGGTHVTAAMSLDYPHFQAVEPNYALKNLAPLPASCPAGSYRNILETFSSVHFLNWKTSYYYYLSHGAGRIKRIHGRA